MGWEVCFVIFARSGEEGSTRYEVRSMIVSGCRVLYHCKRVETLMVSMPTKASACDANAVDSISAAGNKKLRTENYKHLNG